MRVCILHNSSPGGARRLVHEVAGRLATTDEVTICTWGDESEQTPSRVAALWRPAPAVHLPPPLHPFGNLTRSYLGSAKAARAVDDGGFDAALVFACQWAQAPEALRRLRTPHLYFAQEGRRRTVEAGYRPSARRRGVLAPLWRVGRGAYDSIGARLDRRAILAADSIAANSPFTAEQLRRAYGVSAKVIELGVDTDRFRPGGTRTSPAVAVVVGALDPTKGAEFAVRAIAKVPTQHRPALHLIFNRRDDAYMAQVLDTARSAGVEVELLYDVSDAELMAEYQRATLLLAVATNEPFGLTVLEASACGTPTVALDEGGYRRTVDETVNGVLVPREGAALAAAVTAIVTGTRQFDRAAMATWTQERWGWDRCVTEVRELLCQLAAGALTATPRPTAPDAGT